MSIDPVNVIGVLGAALVLVAFVFLELGKWTKENVSYDLSNALGSFCLIVYAVAGQSWPFLILNAVWFLVATRDLFARLTNQHD